MVLNFEGADLKEVIRTLAEILEINYLIDPGIQGVVTIHTAGRLAPGDLRPLFFRILQAYGLTALREGNLYHIVKSTEASRMPLTTEKGVMGVSGEKKKTIIQIIPLSFVAANEMGKILSSFVSTEGAIVTEPESNTLLVVDSKDNIKKILELVNVFDADMFDRIEHRFYTLEHMDAEEMARMLTDVFTTYGVHREEEVKFFSIRRLNLLVVMSAEKRVFNKVSDFIEKMDVPDLDTDPKLYVYFVKNGKAGELGELLNNVFSLDSSEKKDETQDLYDAKEDYQAKAPGPEKEGEKEQGKASVKSSRHEKAGAKSYGRGGLEWNIRVTADEIRNALVIEAAPKDYRIVETILNRLDVLPRQVLIQVIVAEITLDNSDELGMEWELFEDGSGDLETSLISAYMGLGGLKYVIGETDRWRATLAAKASENKLDVLASPTILASDNKEAKIDISTEVPIPSSQYQRETSTYPILETNIQYKDTGIILQVTPHINENGLVSMDIDQEVSEQSGYIAVSQEQELPSFYKRSVNTSLTVKHGQTIVIGGLIREKEEAGFSGVPCLGSVPVLQYVFGRKKNSNSKTELILLITPQVIDSLEDIDAVTDEFKKKFPHALESRKDKDDPFRK